MPTDIDAGLANIDAGLPVINAPAREPRAARRMVREVAQRRFVRLTHQQQAVEALRPLPGPGASVHGITMGAFPGWFLCTAAIELLAEPITEMIVGTLGFGRQNCGDLLALIDAGTVRRATLLVSDYFRHSDRDIFADIRRELEARGQTVSIGRSHAKLILLRTTTRSIVIETSSNLRSSMNHEQFVLSDDAALFDFHAGWIRQLIEETHAT
jgi:hypothetical protein